MVPKLEETVRETEPLYKRIAKECYHEPAFRRAAVLGAAVGLATAGVHFLSSPEVTGDAARTYGFLNGIMDGSFSPVSAVMAYFKGVTIAADHSGVTSQPAGGYYSFGFGTSVVLLWGTAAKGALSRLARSRKAKC